jgi:hypothetical protein
MPGPGSAEAGSPGTPDFAPSEYLSRHVSVACLILRLKRRVTAPDHASDADVLPLQLIEEHVGLERGTYPECPVLDTRLVGVQ